MPFDFNASWQEYIESARAPAQGQFPRERSWDYLWDYVHPNVGTPDGRNSLITGKNRELTSLHLGFFLASWGMFRKGRLRSQNLRFFEALAEELFGRTEQQFWELELDHFRCADQPAILFDKVVKRLRAFLRTSIGQGDTSLIVGKVLLGAWGQCPARDRYFNLGFNAFQNEHRANPRYGGQFEGSFLRYIAVLAHENGWHLYAPRENGTPYPAGKVADMAFFNYGENVG